MMDTHNFIYNDGKIIMKTTNIDGITKEIDVTDNKSMWNAFDDYLDDKIGLNDPRYKK